MKPVAIAAQAASAHVWIVDVTHVDASKRRPRAHVAANRRVAVQAQKQQAVAVPLRVAANRKRVLQPQQKQLQVVRVESAKRDAIAVRASLARVKRAAAPTADAASSSIGYFGNAARGNGRCG